MAKSNKMEQDLPKVDSKTVLKYLMNFCSCFVSWVQSAFCLAALDPFLYPGFEIEYTNLIH